MKKQNYLKWDEYFMGIALLSANRSQNNKILSVGYNGMPLGCNDDEFPWDREGEPLNTKYLYVCHAELNAILNYTGTDIRGSKIYTTLFPSLMSRSVFSWKEPLVKAFAFLISMCTLPFNRVGLIGS